MDRHHLLRTELLEALEVIQPLVLGPLQGEEPQAEAVQLQVALLASLGAAQCLQAVAELSVEQQQLLLLEVELNVEAVEEVEEVE